MVKEDAFARGRGRGGRGIVTSTGETWCINWLMLCVFERSWKRWERRWGVTYDNLLRGLGLSASYLLVVTVCVFVSVSRLWWIFNNLQTFKIFEGVSSLRVSWSGAVLTRYLWGFLFVVVTLSLIWTWTSKIYCIFAPRYVPCSKLVIIGNQKWPIQWWTLSHEESLVSKQVLCWRKKLQSFS